MAASRTPAIELQKPAEVFRWRTIIGGGKLQVTFNSLEAGLDAASEAMFANTEGQPLLENGPDLGFQGPAVPRGRYPQPRARHRVKPADRKRRHRQEPTWRRE